MKDEIIDAIVSEGLVSGYCNYWVDLLLLDTPKDVKFPTMDDRIVYAIRHNQCRIIVDDGEYHVTVSKIERALSQIDSLIVEDIDAEMADYILQNAIFREVRYA